jgi:serine/threonine protein kinase
LAYLAPEVLSRQGHGKSVDWYLLGVLMYEMLFGIPPFYTNISKDALFHNIKYATLSFPKTRNKVSLQAKNIISKLMNRNPNKRLGSGYLDSAEIKSHQFFAGIDFKKIKLKQFIPPRVKDATSFKNDNSLKIPKIITDQTYSPNKILMDDMIQNKKSSDASIEGWTFIGGHSKFVLHK